MYKHILVVVDGSDTSDLALQEAIRLAKEQQAALRLVHVVDETPTYITMDTMYALADFQKSMREAGQKVLATCAATAQCLRHYWLGPPRADLD
jgi:nucleotide-binding universal stress UspA family protein